MSLVSHKPPPPRSLNNSQAHRAARASLAHRLRQTRHDRGRRSTPDSRGSWRPSNRPYWDFASVACHGQWRFVDGGRTSWTVVFPIPCHTLQGDQPRHLDFWNRSGRDGLGRSAQVRQSQPVSHGPWTTRDCASGWIERSSSHVARGETRDCEATRIWDRQGGGAVWNAGRGQQLWLDEMPLPKPPLEGTQGLQGRQNGRDNGLTCEFHRIQT